MIYRKSNAALRVLLLATTVLLCACSEESGRSPESLRPWWSLGQLEMSQDQARKSDNYGYVEFDLSTIPQQFEKRVHGALDYGGLDPGSHKHAKIFIKDMMITNGKLQIFVPIFEGLRPEQAEIILEESGTARTGIFMAATPPLQIPTYKNRTPIDIRARSWGKSAALSMTITPYFRDGHDTEWVFSGIFLRPIVR